MNYVKVTALSTLVLAILTGMLVVLGVVSFIARTLPTAGVIRNVVKEEGRKIASDSVEKIEESMEKFIQILLDYKEKPVETRAEVFTDVFDRVIDKGYVRKVLDRRSGQQGYVTSSNWKENRRLLSEDERDAIDIIVRDFESQDQMTLMYMVLSNNDMKRKVISRGLEGSKKFQIHLSPYEVMGIIGGYIGEKKFE